MNSSLLQNLSFLSTTVRQVQQDDIEILGSLPALHYLNLLVVSEDMGVHNENLGECIVGAGLFPCLVYCQIWGYVKPTVFQQGAMPSLRTLDFRLSVQEAKGISVEEAKGIARKKWWYRLGPREPAITPEGLGSIRF